MNIEPINSAPISVRQHLPAMPRKSCKFCGSVFVTEQECESCGRQFSKETLGAPGGEKSFYAIRSCYQYDAGWFLSRFDSFLAKDAGVRVRYLALLKKRFLTLLDHFQRKSAGAVSSHAYLVEFRDLVYEMQRMKVSADYIYDMVELGEGTPLMPKLRTIVNEVYAFKNSSTWTSIWRYRVASGPRLGFLFSLVVAYACLCASALWLFSYLIR